MKKYKTLLGVVLALHLVSSVILLLLLPDTIPAHYNFAGEVTRYGSKFEKLLFPLCNLALAGFMLGMSRIRTLQDRERKVLLLSAIGLAVMFWLMDLGFTLPLLRGREGRPAIPQPGRLTAALFGGLLLLLGNVMPKARRNALFGLRTPWSLADDETWRKSQRFGGFTAIGLGLVFLLMALFADSRLCLFLCPALLLIWALVCVLASWTYYRKRTL